MPQSILTEAGILLTDWIIRNRWAIIFISKSAAEIDMHSSVTAHCSTMQLPPGSMQALSAQCPLRQSVEHWIIFISVAWLCMYGAGLQGGWAVQPFSISTPSVTGFDLSIIFCIITFFNLPSCLLFFPRAIFREKAYFYFQSICRSDQSWRRTDWTRRWQN